MLAALHQGAGVVSGAGANHEPYTMLAEAAAQRRDLEALRKYASLAEAAARHIDHKLHMGIALRALSELS